MSNTNEQPTPKGLNQLAKEIHENAVAHGWWEEERELPEILMLCVSELAEALEEYRDDKPMLYYSGKDAGGNRAEIIAPVEPYITKPEGVATELADCLIRILDYCGSAGIDIEKVVEIKNRYNATRPYRHGGKKC